MPQWSEDSLIMERTLYASSSSSIAGPFTLDPRTKFNAHRMHIHRIHTWIRFWVMRIESIHLWRWIGTESEPNSLFIHRITIKSHTVTPPRLLKLSRLGHHTCCSHCPICKLWWPIMLGHHWLDAVEKETVYRVVSCSSSKFMFHIKSTTATR